MNEQLEKLFYEAINRDAPYKASLLNILKQHIYCQFYVKSCSIKVIGLNKFRAEMCLTQKHNRVHKDDFESTEVYGYFEHNISFDFSITFEKNNNTVKVNIENQSFDNCKFFHFLSYDSAQIIDLHYMVAMLRIQKNCFVPDKYHEYVETLLESRCLSEIYKEWLIRNFISSEYVA